MSGTPPLPHARAFELLPWLLNRSLTPSECDAVEQHVRICIPCRRELRVQQRLQDAMRAQPTVHVSPHAGLERLDRHLDHQAREPAPRWRHYAATFGPFSMAAAAGFALLALLLWFTPVPALKPGQYTTLAAGGQSTAPLLDVVFAQDTTEAQMRALLDRIGGEIVAGPSGVGRYTIRLTDGRADDAQVAVVIRSLASDPHVRLATPSMGAVPP